MRYRVMPRNATIRRIRRRWVDVLLRRPAQWVWEITRSSLLMFGRPGDSINYSASVQCNLQCDRAILDTLNGQDFYRLLAEDGFESFTSQGITVVECNVKTSHLRLIRRLSDRLDIVVTRTGRMGRNEMSWLEIRKKEAHHDAA